MMKCKVCGAVFVYSVPRAHIEEHGITLKEYKAIKVREHNFSYKNYAAEEERKKTMDIESYVYDAVIKSCKRRDR